MKIGFVISHYPAEKRVPILPEDIKGFENEIVIEKGLGRTMGIEDHAYEAAGCTLLSRKEVFASCDTIVSLKLLQPRDYDDIREGQMIIGWTHPEVSGKPFMIAQGIPKKLIIVDLDNITPAIYYQNRSIEIPWIPSHFINRNSFYAGFAATSHALMNRGIIPDESYNIAILGSGNVSQGAMNFISKFSTNVRMFYRRTMNEFFNEIEEFDIIINGIQIPLGTPSLVTYEHQRRMKPGALIIGAAADGDGTIEGIQYTPYENPVYEREGKYYYCVDNAPSIYHQAASRAISASFAKWVYREDVQKLYELADEIINSDKRNLQKI